ncbi:Succinate-semialdehyde dehydrogenase [NADP+] [Klebsiella pneumoniae subsp. pneumoniae ST258-K28BO]|nr:Succinate-semialdehyde dehydrogenase [NADP+] [Klebsiella pneumoniae subsp. pneumoniae ST258-K28BO]
MQLNDMTLFRQQALIDGQWRDAPNGDVIAVTNPANGEQLGSVPKMGADETREAIEAANRALPAWRALTAKERANILRRWFDLMMENQDDLARLMTLEQGKPLAEAKGEISYAASFIEWFAEEGKRIYGDTIPGHQADKRLLVIKQPIGVTAAITPWNFPAAMITRKAGPALAAGCTMVLKPASQTPFSALALAELANRAGIPAGVFNVVTGSAGAVGGELTTGRTGESRRDPRRSVQRGHRLRRRGRRRTDQQPAGAQALLYRLYRDWPPADGAVRERHQKSLPGAGRQRAVYRL